MKSLLDPLFPVTLGIVELQGVTTHVVGLGFAVGMANGMARVISSPY